MKELIAYIGKFGTMDSEEKASIQEAFKCIYIRKGDYFAENGRISDKIAFVEDGVFRSVYYNKKGDDFTNYFIYEGRFIGDLHSFQGQLPASDYIEAVTDATIWSIDAAGFALLEKEVSVWPVLISKLYAFVSESKLKTASLMKNLEAKERYALFLKHYPGLANRVPLSMLASYLGITSSSLSRIRRNG
ncbi:Crp/Fnr family transcriptional regulator [Sphingobacterium psychroaquaticum]|uniref:cAMP-binding domain of CRP or a regulatory subunit of cAMP-dependent protein kinases n=1 Tax=Sphingobacterium psychroaquaticum TaxID=561061 RepID=A0A1X7JPC3_9SPHI|nr:Crp/Fnr family transcriptional regulator [Sphingobacterium psychroaquaticum]SMG30105.1 cAMP-binding domain of CRP or a regulatory subunit of cAMP-dependent protein kinases [Sphingobacterium psychroaquaticum]